MVTRGTAFGLVLSLAFGSALGVPALGCGDKRRPRRSGDAGPAVVVVDQGRAGGEIVAERESNDETPGPLVLPGGVRGAIDRSGDLDQYAFTVAQAGTLALSLSAVADADLVVELQDGQGTKLVTGDNGPAGVAEGLPNVVLEPGPYRVVVREFVKKGPPPRTGKPKRGAPDAAPEPGVRSGPSAPYTLEATFGPLPEAGDEREPDDTAAFASAATLPGSVRGFCGWRKDRDVWKVPIAGLADDEALAVDVDGVAGVSLRVSILDGTEAILLERQGRTGEAVQLRNVLVREGEPHYYVVISCPKANVSERYELRVASAPIELDEETEPNDKLETAGPLADIPGQGGVRVGFLSHGDVDVYKLDPGPAPRTLSVIVEPPASMDAAISVIDQKGQLVAGPADAAGKGRLETLRAVPVPADTALFVKVTAKPGAEASERYRLRWSTEAVDPLAPPPGVPGVDDEP